MQAITADANASQNQSPGGWAAQCREPEIVEVAAVTGLITMLNLFQQRA